MTGAELSVLGTILVAVLALLIKTFVPAKKANNPGNPGNGAEIKVAHALMLKSLERIEKALKSIEEKLP